MRTFIIILFIIFSPILLAKELFVLNKPLQFSTDSSMQKSKMLSPGDGLTVFKILENNGKVLKVKMIQHNGQASNKIFYTSASWFKQGTKEKNEKAFKLHLNPHDVVDNMSRPQVPCLDVVKTDPPKPKVDTPNLCNGVIDNPKSTAEQYMSCFSFLQAKLQKRMSVKKLKYRANQTLSGLYDLNSSEQKLMAYLLTMYGEARGAKPTYEQMAGVMKVIENRTRYAHETGHPEANELDVVLQDSQFSMYNSNDRNWEIAINAKPEDMLDAIKVYQNKDKIKFKSEVKAKAKLNMPENVFHYITTALKESVNSPEWSKHKTPENFKVNGQSLNQENGHEFFAGVAWSFNPTNKYKKIAKHDGIFNK